MISNGNGVQTKATAYQLNNRLVTRNQFHYAMVLRSVLALCHAIFKWLADEDPPKVKDIFGQG